MREVRVLGGEHNGHVHFVDDWVDKIRMEVHKNEPLLKRVCGFKCVRVNN